MAENLNASTTATGGTADGSLLTYTHVIYALHTASVLMGLATFWSIAGSFIFGLPSIVAVIMNYARQADARGSFLDTHFRWQIRTFWFALLWLIVIWAVSLPLMLILVGIVTFYVGRVALGIWVIYRIARGWLALRERRPVGV
ncbi:MAG TPA: hypothetical protein VGL55_10500 [Steroidobacteraceae bacterium]|jgi:uncharacterized membrane protein